MVLIRIYYVAETHRIWAIVDEDELVFQDYNGFLSVRLEADKYQTRRVMSVNIGDRIQGGNLTVNIIVRGT